MSTIDNNNSEATSMPVRQNEMDRIRSIVDKIKTEMGSWTRPRRGAIADDLDVVEDLRTAHGFGGDGVPPGQRARAWSHLSLDLRSQGASEEEAEATKVFKVIRSAEWWNDTFAVFKRVLDEKTDCERNTLAIGLVLHAYCRAINTTHLSGDRTAQGHHTWSALLNEVEESGIAKYLNTYPLHNVNGDTRYMLNILNDNFKTISLVAEMEKEIIGTAEPEQYHPFSLPVRLFYSITLISVIGICYQYI